MKTHSGQTVFWLILIFFNSCVSDFKQNDELVKINSSLDNIQIEITKSRKQSPAESKEKL